jgi:hypothetical protein
MQASITLAGRQYIVRELPLRKNAAWRADLQNTVMGAADLFAAAPDTDVSNPQAVAALIRGVGNLVLGSTDVVVDLLFAYSPELAADREHIEGNAFESEVVEAFTEVVKLAFPFLAVGRRLISMLPRT